MQLHFKAHDFTGLREIVGPDNSPSEQLELALIKLEPGATLDLRDEGRESVLVILGGRCSVEVDGKGTWRDLGEREDVFAGRATAVYVPPGTPYRLSTGSGVEIGVCRAPAESDGDAYVVRPEEVRSRTVGKREWRREVRDIVDQSRPAKTLVVGETLNEPGSWSSYPPHKHDVPDPPGEVRMQEIYHYRLQPRHGFGLQRIYSPERDIDACFAVEDGDTVLIPFGYHPVVAAGGYRLYYLWMLAGDGRALHPREDPAHSSIGEMETG